MKPPKEPAEIKDIAAHAVMVYCLSDAEQVAVAKSLLMKMIEGGYGIDDAERVSLAKELIKGLPFVVQEEA